MSKAIKHCQHVSNTMTWIKLLNIAKMYRTLGHE